MKHFCGMELDEEMFNAALEMAAKKMKRFNRRLEAKPFTRMEYFWTCPVCKVENAMQYGDGDSDRHCTNCKSVVYVGQASKAQEENWDY